MFFPFLRNYFPKSVPGGQGGVPVSRRVPVPDGGVERLGRHGHVHEQTHVRTSLFSCPDRTSDNPRAISIQMPRSVGWFEPYLLNLEIPYRR